MSTTTTRTRKAPATKVADAATKAPAKAAPAKAVPAEKRAYQAQGRCGVTNVRSFSTEMQFAVDVADKDGKSDRARKGQIWSFFASEEAAKGWAAKKVAEGYDAIVVEAKQVTK